MPWILLAFYASKFWLPQHQISDIRARFHITYLYAYFFLDISMPCTSLTMLNFVYSSSFGNASPTFGSHRPFSFVSNRNIRYFTTFILIRVPFVIHFSIPSVFRYSRNVSYICLSLLFFHYFPFDVPLSFFLIINSFHMSNLFTSFLCFCKASIRPWYSEDLSRGGIRSVDQEDYRPHWLKCPLLLYILQYSNGLYDRGLCAGRQVGYDQEICNSCPGYPLNAHVCAWIGHWWHWDEPVMTDSLSHFTKADSFWPIFEKAADWTAQEQHFVTLGESPSFE